MGANISTAPAKPIIPEIFEPGVGLGQWSFTLPNGLIFKFGNVVRAGNSTTVDFTTAFTTDALIAVATPLAAISSYTPCVSFGRINLTIFCANAVDSYLWFAIGY